MPRISARGGVGDRGGAIHGVGGGFDGRRGPGVGSGSSSWRCWSSSEGPFSGCSGPILARVSVDDVVESVEGAFRRRGGRSGGRGGRVGPVRRGGSAAMMRRFGAEGGGWFSGCSGPFRTGFSAGGGVRTIGGRIRGVGGGFSGGGGRIPVPEWRVGRHGAAGRPLASRPT